MVNTPTWSITYPDSSSNLTPLESHFQAVATTTDAALTSLKSNIRGGNSSDTISSLATNISALQTRLPLNTQVTSGTPTGVPVNNGVEGSLSWDSNNDILYIYANSAWKILWSAAIPVQDTNWQNITVNSGFAGGTSTMIPKYRTINNIIYLRGSFLNTGITTANTSYVVGQLPVGTYPASESSFFIPSSSSDMTKSGRLAIKTDGKIEITTGSVTGGVPSFYINCSYPLG